MRLRDPAFPFRQVVPGLDDLGLFRRQRPQRNIERIGIEIRWRIDVGLNGSPVQLGSVPARVPTTGVPVPVRRALGGLFKVVGEGGTPGKLRIVQPVIART